jgi:CheY-like chemotaxis protein
MDERRWPKQVKILYIDDDTDLIAIYTRFFDDPDYDFKTALNAEDGLETAKTFQPDLIITDVILPEMNGVDLCRTIRMEESLKDTIIMLVTGMEVESDDLVEGFHAGADEYLMKPFSKDEIMARVNALLRIKRLKDELASITEMLSVMTAENDRLRGILEQNRLNLSTGVGNSVPTHGDHGKTVAMRLYEVKPGMRLAEGLYTVKGAKFLSENTVLTEENITQISLYSKVDLLEETVFIKQ